MAFDLTEMLANVPIPGTVRQVTLLPVEDILPDPNNFYLVDNSIRDLADNIQTVGLLDPITVRTHPEETGKYMVISGHRRRAACEFLWKEQQLPAFRQIECFVDDSVQDPDLLQLKLIFGNANTRKLSGWEISQQTEQVEKLLYSLAEKGYTFEGRMRDHVAKVCDVSKSKISRLKVIRENLIPKLAEKWQAGKLNDSLAYEIARQTPEDQDYLSTALSRKALYITDDVGTLCENFRLLESLPCRKSGGSCAHAAKMKRHSASTSYRWDRCDRCCCTCSHLEGCADSCSNAVVEKKALKDKAEKAVEKANAKKAAQDAPYIEAVTKAVHRIAERKKEMGISTEDFLRTRDDVPTPPRYYVDQINNMESGARPIERHSVCQAAIGADDLLRLIRTADLLQCSIDYLLGRSDSIVGSAPEGMWHTGDPEKIQSYVVMLRWSRNGSPVPEQAYWSGSEWLVYDSPIDYDDGEEVVCWTDFPEGTK